MVPGHQLSDGLNMWQNCASNHHQANTVWRVSYYWAPGYDASPRLTASIVTGVDSPCGMQSWSGGLLSTASQILMCIQVPWGSCLNVGSDSVVPGGAHILHFSQAHRCCWCCWSTVQTLNIYSLVLWIFSLQPKIKTQLLLVWDPMGCSSYGTCPFPCFYLDVSEQKFNFQNDKKVINVLFWWSFLLTSQSKQIGIKVKL